MFSRLLKKSICIEGILARHCGAHEKCPSFLAHLPWGPRIWNFLSSLNKIGIFQQSVRGTDTGKDTEKGFTLLEVMIAVSILSGVVLSIIVSLNYHISAAARNRDIVVASMLGSSLEGEIRASGLPETREGAFDGFPGFTWSLDIKDAEWGLRRIDIKVRNDGKEIFDIITHRKKE